MRSFFPVSSLFLTLTLAVSLQPVATGATAIAGTSVTTQPGAALVLIDDTGLLGRPQPQTDVRYSAPEAPYVIAADDPYHTGAGYSTGTSAEAQAAWSIPAFTVASGDAFHTGAAYSTGTSEEAVSAWQPAAFVIATDDPYHTGAAYSTGTSQRVRQIWQPIKNIIPQPPVSEPVGESETSGIGPLL